jgi:hypothetical protein
MVLKRFEDRLIAWRGLREKLTSASDPVQTAIDYWNTIPKSIRNLDPYDSATWPDPWEMIEENVYCEYTSTLAIGYTLMLTEKFKDWHYEIQVGLDKDQSKLYYMLIAGDRVIGLDQEKSVHIKDIPNNIHIEKTHVLSEQF